MCYPDIKYPDSSNTLECIAMMDQADKNFHSWTYWMGSLTSNNVWDNEGNLNFDTAVVFARPYPMATSGMPAKVK